MILEGNFHQKLQGQYADAGKDVERGTLGQPPQFAPQQKSNSGSISSRTRPLPKFFRVKGVFLGVQSYMFPLPMQCFLVWLVLNFPTLGSVSAVPWLLALAWSILKHYNHVRSELAKVRLGQAPSPTGAYESQNGCGTGTCQVT